ncbi:transcription termination factor Rho [Aeromicrobium sp. PE09-221]|uniref:transcription termination factor Rho n=1 Tax=Aeromicrobium sp. PE09-221 TaxID=1898043 RepID=UPI000B63C500|nr:transcription termination factor Rho [Aeromicrobium sp. PE09-221]OUZ11250.1 transcription termination factor Rho [Aeromicrobium sp. PE09-221]
MTETSTTETTAAPKKTARKSGGSLGGKVLAELQEIAAGLGIDGTKMRKGQLIDAIKEARGEAPKAEAPAAQAPKAEAPVAQAAKSQAASESSDATAAAPAAAEAPADTKPTRRRATRQSAAAPAAEGGGEQDDAAGKGGQVKNDQAKNDQPKDQAKDAPAKGGQGKGDQKSDQNKNDKNDQSGDQNKGGQKNDQSRGGQGKNDNRGGDNQGNRGNDNRGGDNQGNRGNRGNDNRGNRGNSNDDDGGRRRNRRGRGRGGRGLEAEPTYTEDDVLVPAAGILDILDNYAFVRTTGYLPSENDVYVAMSLVRRLGLRRGDAVVGQVRQPREGERKEKFNPMVKIDSVNGLEVDDAKRRVEFSKLTPLYPSERLRLEGEAGGLTGRVIDLVSPIGKGQRGLIVSPPKAGKTMVMQQVANAITENNPECHLMIVLVDERPEEVTDFQRTVKGEVISSTFDRPAGDHTTVAELAIERAKRLVELGHDVVVLLDGITRLGRAYNLAAPASGRIMSGGVDSSALYPPKKFFGAARNIEDGGSLTILATALIETGSRMDEVIFEEFKGTGNWELRLRREFADKRIFPAIDVDASSTRREELLMARDELSIIWKLRRVLSGLEGQQGLELVLGKLKKTSNNVEFLMEINKTMPGGVNNGDS